MDIKMKYYKKAKSPEEILVKSVDDNGNYSIASNLDPEPDGFIDHAYNNWNGWDEITRQEAASIIGYDPDDGAGRRGI
jgi:hypothetical protein